ncbi:MAG: tRNA (guanosine(46)-N7)-methyltransferase TrmB [Caldiserica bacterium]|nr:tRNA (guanosine(46)-N7)-methyltransferase TrmB [Caldisericota bacterium]
MGFAKYLIEPRLFAGLPPDWRWVFGRAAPLVVEIGFGNGEFLAEEAARHPENDYLGFELTLTCIEKACRKFHAAGLANVRVVRLDARFGLRELFADGSVREVIVNFPCPWPKARHADRRLVNEGFARTLAAVLESGGRFVLATDARSFAEEARDNLAATGCFVIQGPYEVDGEPRTRYERKWRSKGLAIYRLVAEKKAAAAVERIAEGKMPHARLKAELDKGDIPRRVVGLKEVWPRGAFVVKEAFVAPDRDEVLLRAFAADGEFHQQFFISVSRDRKGWIVQLDGATVPFRTPAVKRAVFAVASALEKESGT